MHRGVQELIRWVEAHRGAPEVKPNPPATSAELSSLEAQLGGPIPGDLRAVLTRFNGGTLPNGTMLRAGNGPGTMEAEVRTYAEAVGADFLDPELLLPFHRTLEGSLLCFDRSAAPVSDTWPIVDYFDDTGETRLVHRTFDGWCRLCVDQWSSEDFGAEFTLDTYLRQGERHARFEPDVATAHATVAHAQRRAGMPEKALASYLAAARCVPSLPWCDWEALKIAALLGRPDDAYEAASRLASRAPGDRWAERETTPPEVADVIGRVMPLAVERSPWVRLLDQLVEQASDEEEERVHAVRRAVLKGAAAPPPAPPRAQPVVPPREDLKEWWQAAQQAFAEGRLRDDDLLLDARMDPLRAHYELSELLRIRRDF